MDFYRFYYFQTGTVSKHIGRPLKKATKNPARKHYYVLFEEILLNALKTPAMMRDLFLINTIVLIKYNLCLSQKKDSAGLNG